jgi:microsomal dipeptidase-like Zn-dependent dipeptidase
MRRLAEHNAAWMEIAYSAADARRIIASGRLAVVLGAEFDRLGELDGFSSLEDEAQYLSDLGIRQVIPIHGIDNRVGGAALFEPAYNSLNDLLKRGERNLGKDDLDRWPPVFFELRNGGCDRGPLAGQRGECVLFRFSATQERAFVARTVFSLFSPTPTLGLVQVPRYREHDGHMNVRGLSADGRAYIRALLSRGMLIGIDHMSQQSTDDLRNAVADGDSPLLASHAHFRALSIQERRRTTAVGFLPDEFDVADRDVEMIRQRGGVVGVFTYENPLDPHPIVAAPFENDCSASTKTFGYAFLYGLARMGGAGVGLATDFTFVPSTAPRFGPDACWGLKGHWDARPDVGPLRAQYQPERQEAGVRYQGRPPAPGVRVAANTPLAPYVMGRRTYDFNVDGLAHYGLLPDFLQDLRNIGFGAREYGALFSSAEAYLQMWEKAERAAAATPPAQPFTPRALPCEQICRGLCP